MTMEQQPVQQELFICDIADVALKDVMQEMEHPFYSLSKKPQTAIRKYEHNGNFIEVTPSVKGQATIFDKDILIFAISQLMAAKNRGEEISKVIQINPRQALIFAHRGTGGREYDSLIGAIDRLAGTRISTNIKTGQQEQYTNFGLIEAGSVKRKLGREGRLQHITITISDWLYRAVMSEEVKSIDPAYFDLAKPLERRLYEIGKKHIGSKQIFEISLDKLYKKTGTMSPMNKFKFNIKSIAKANQLPEMSLAYSEDRNVLIFQWKEIRALESPQHQDSASFPSLPKGAHAAVIKKFPNADTKRLEAAYREWWESSDKALPENLIGAFYGYCKKIIESDSYTGEYDKPAKQTITDASISVCDNTKKLVNKHLQS